MNKLYVIAVQWHIEMIPDADEQAFDIFKMFIYKRKDKIEYKIF